MMMVAINDRHREGKKWGREELRKISNNSIIEAVIPALAADVCWQDWSIDMHEQIAAKCNRDQRI